jgi:ABC-type molybdate transport system substrate-binding protein
VFRTALTLALGLCSSAVALAQGVTVFAAASLTDAFRQVRKAYRASGG